MTLETLIKKKHGTIIDVRTPEEFNGGHAEGSINVPLHELLNRMEELKTMELPLVLCCASGGRSGQAHAYLTGQGLDCLNAGSWFNVQYYQNQNI